MVVKKLTLDDLCINVLLTSVCNAGCPGCIANEYMSGKKTFELIPEENIKVILEMLKNEPIQQINLLGGEPSLHPRATEIAADFDSTRIPVGFSTNGLWSPEFREKFAKLKPRLEVEITYLGPTAYSIERMERLNHAFELLRNHSTSLGIIISEPNQDYSGHLEVCKKYGFDLRWAFLEPTRRSGLTRGYRSLTDIKSLSEVAIKAIKEANQRGIKTWADLTVPLCAIGEENLSLFEGEENDIQFGCPPFFDISPNLDIWRCLPLAPQETPKLTDFNSFRDAYLFVNKVKEKYLGSGCFEDCDSCKYLDDLCSGGPAIVKELKDDRRI